MQITDDDVAARQEEAQPALLLAGVGKRYGSRDAVADLTLRMAPGETLGFLGPNGAGKTTTIRIATGFLRPTRGSVHLLGCDMADARQAQRARARLGYVPDVAGLDPGATGAWLLQELAGLQGTPPLDQAELIDRLELDAGDLRRPMGRLSRGTRQKINIVQGLQHRPDLLILDEPTEGLDPLTKRALFDILRGVRARGGAIFFSSHVLAEVEELCDRVALIRRGRLVAVSPIATLRAAHERRVTVQLAHDAPAAAGERLAQTPTVANLRQLGPHLWQFAVRDLNALTAALATLPLVDLTVEQPSLEQLFLQYYRREEFPAGEGSDA
jgi:ABC-2 type transport system ATP-binding protein